MEDKTQDDAKTFGLVLPKRPELDPLSEGAAYEVWEENWDIVMMFMRILWHPLFVCSPTKFCWCNAFFVETFNRPRIAELVDFFWLVSNLRVAFGDVNDLGAGELREHIELLGFKSSL